MFSHDNVHYLPEERDNLSHHIHVVENFGPAFYSLCCLNCTKFGQLVLRKIIKIGPTRCQILRLKCTKLVFGWAPPQTSLRKLTALPRALARLRGPTSKGRAWQACSYVHRRNNRGDRGRLVPPPTFRLGDQQCIGPLNFLAVVFKKQEISQQVLLLNETQSLLRTPQTF